MVYDADLASRVRERLVGTLRALDRVGQSAPKSGKNRMHVDSDLDAEVRRLENIGARRLSEEPVLMGTFSWVVMADPEGNEFCVVRLG